MKGQNSNMTFAHLNFIVDLQMQHESYCVIAHPHVLVWATIERTVSTNIGCNLQPMALTS